MLVPPLNLDRRDLCREWEKSRTSGRLAAARRLRTTTFYRRWFMPVGSVIIALVALYWFVQRAFDFQGPF